MYSPVCFLFSAFSVSVLCSKLVHLVTYASTIPATAFIVYLPTFFLADFLAICFLRVLLRPVNRWFFLIFPVVGCLISLLTLGGSASQLGFYIKTGGELEWHEATSFATSKDGLKVLLTGSWAVLASGGVILVISYFAQNLLYRTVGDFLLGIYMQTATALRALIRLCRGGRQTRRDVENDADLDAQRLVDTDPSNDDNDDSEAHMLIGDGEKASPAKPKPFRCLVSIPSWLLKTATVAFLTITVTLRPHKPYDHMSITLPISLLEIFKAEPDHCIEQRRITTNAWPLPDLVDKANWEEPQGDFKGWAPGANSAIADQYRKTSPHWLPDTAPRGFSRWDPRRFESKAPGTFGAEKEAWKLQCPNFDLREPYYNPANDPLKISNLDTDVLEPLKGALEDGSVKIKHVVFILMESLREELFPIRQGSDIHKSILQFNDEDMREEVNAKLAHLTPHIERLTGISGGFTDANGKSYDAPELKWDDKTEEGFGGINVVGGFTTATMSTKSFSANHCGAWPMPVEKFDEADTDSYQPCLPQVLGLLNEGKDLGTHASDDFREQPWHPALFESVTERYDRQEIFDQKIGFKHIVCKAELEHDPKYNESDPFWKKVNYFGFAEPVLKPHIRDYITNTTANNQRIYMSHFTSTTHHAWDTPDWFDTTDYLPTGGPVNWHKNFNKYLNTIRFHDAWMAELMQLFDDVGISNETLIVFAGDHGQAFKEDYYKTGTYEVPHVSNFRVPITFRHPHLPRIQYEANATTISVLPTILDLLINSGSLNEKDTRVASDLVQDYEGQSLIRPYKKSHNGRRAWNFGVINSGAGMLAVTSADAPWRLVMPLGKVFEYTFTDLGNDPLELSPIASWSLDGLLDTVRNRVGDDAAVWAEEAQAVARWWSLERQRLWKYHLAN
ncbi:hypothetical protein QQX98_013187 [Neonectria punicea]|uniref:Sulfatase N-terminal domain-containing protein n=1 Tax=Neonectria punicea TaxID=979145 RepID=A0ABR1GGX9_9HYPO